MLVILLAVGEETPTKDIEAAQELWAEYKERKEKEMPLTKSFRETVVERAKADPEFRRELLRHAVELMIGGDLATGKAVLRN